MRADAAIRSFGAAFNAHRAGAFFLTALALGCSTHLATAAENCDLAQAASVTMTLDEAGRPVVPVEIACLPKMMLLDTGGVFSMLSQKTFEELGTAALRRNDIVLADIRGNRLDKSVIVPSMTIGRVRGNTWRFWIVAPNMDLGSTAGEPTAGTLAPDLLSHYDVDLDFRNKTMKLFTQDHCPGKVVYWMATSVAIIPFDFSENHITVPATIDGKRVQALVDTGAGQTTMNLTVAQRRFGLDVTDKSDSTLHQFKTLELEGLRVDNPMIALARDAMAAAMPFDSGRIDPPPRQGLADLIIGQNVIGKFHVYIAYRERKLYITD